MAKSTAGKENPIGTMQNFKRTLQDLDERFTQISTGSLIFDIFLDGGYVPGMARFVAEPEHGKTLQALTWAKNWLEHWGDKGRVLYYDSEGRLTGKKIRLSGIDKIKDFDQKIEITRWNVFDDIGYEIFEKVTKNPDGLHYFIVIDCLDMLITKADLGKTLSEAEKIGAAQTMATLLLKHVGVFMQDQGHHLHILSQIRANINTNNPNSPKTKMSGANSLRHAADIIGEIQKNWGDMYLYENPKGGTKAEKGNIIGHYCTIRFTKTPNEKTGQIIRVPIKRGAGIWREREVLDLAIAFGQITCRGAWHDLNPEWERKINESVTARLRSNYFEDKYNQVINEMPPAELKRKSGELKEKLQTEAEQVIPQFQVENKWQGYQAVFSYLEANKEVVNWMDREFRSVLTSESVSQEDIEGEEDAVA